MSPQAKEVLESLSRKLDRISPEPMSPVESHLHDCLSALVAVLIHENKGD